MVDDQGKGHGNIRTADAEQRGNAARAATPERQIAARSGLAWQLLLYGGLVCALVYVVAPYGTFASAFYVVATATPALVIAIAARRLQPLFVPRAWLLIAGALALTAVGHAIWYWLDLRGLEPFPSVADVFCLAAYPLLAAALWELGRNGAQEDDAFSEALIVGISSAVVGWTVLIVPYVDDPDLTRMQLLVSAAYPIGDLILLPLIVRLVLRDRARILAHHFLLLGMLVYLTTDFLYAYGNSAGWYAPGGITDGLWLVAYALFMAAAWHPSAAVKPRSSASGDDLSTRRLYVLGAASILVPTLILTSSDLQADIVRVAAVASILIFLLIMYRMAGLMRRTRRQAKELERLSMTDPLTGAANRRCLEHGLARDLARAERSGTGLHVAYFDVDYFKEYNDTLGHAAGDALLQALVRNWRKMLRPTDILARIGGDEFVVVLPETELEECIAVLERLRQRLPYGQTCSAGVTAVQPGDTAETLLARADQALYEAKNSGRDRMVTSLALDEGAKP